MFVSIRTCCDRHEMVLTPYCTMMGSGRYRDDAENIQELPVESTEKLLLVGTVQSRFIGYVR